MFANNDIPGFRRDIGHHFDSVFPAAEERQM